METLKEEYEKIKYEREKILEQINALYDDETIKKYEKLKSENNKLFDEEKKLYKKIKTKEYSSCNHIWVNTLNYIDWAEGRSYNYYGCIKCGLDKRVFYFMSKYYNPDLLTLDKRIMYDFMKTNQYNFGKNTNLLCDLDLAKAIYVKIKENHPDIDDKTTIKYFKDALLNVENNEVSDEIKENIAKRLSLNPKFNKWNK